MGMNHSPFTSLYGIAIVKRNNRPIQNLKGSAICILMCFRNEFIFTLYLA